jgi:ATP-dependent Clp protease ATP-binding subunit ClpC
VVVLAQEQARLLGHGSIGSEHLLLGLLALGGPVAETLERRGVALEVVQHQVDEIVGPVTRQVGRHVPFTPRAKEVLELSLREALRLEHRSIGPAHVMLGLLREGQGIACQALVVLGVDLGQLQGVVEAVANDRAWSTPTLADVGTLSLPGARAVLRALEEAFGDDAEIAFLRLRRSGQVQVVVKRRDADDLDVVVVANRGDRWEVELDQPG